MRTRVFLATGLPVAIAVMLVCGCSNGNTPPAFVEARTAV